MTANLTALFREEDLHRGFGKVDDLGVGVNDEVWSRNIDQANAKGQQPCNHCGRGLNPDTCYVAIYIFNRQTFVALDVEQDDLMALTEEIRWRHYRTGEERTERRPSWSWIFLGSECAKNLPTRFRMLHRDFPASKWHDTDAHHVPNWGTW